MKRALALCFCGLVTAANADSGTTLSGTQLSYGPSSNGNSLFAATHNPAIAAITVRPEERWRLAYLPSISASLEVGDVNNFIDELDELIDLLDDASLVGDSISETLARFNALLDDMGRNGYTRSSVSVTAPLMPLYWQPGFMPGTFFAELSLNTQIRASVLADELSYDDQTSSFSTASSAYLKSGLEKTVALGYARELFNDHFATQPGRLLGGAKLKLIQLDLSKQVMRLQLLEGRDIEDVIKDEYKNNRISTTAVSVDVGLAWLADYYRIGLTLTNINSPSFRYGSIGVACEQYQEDSFERQNCEVAGYFALERGLLKTQEKHTKHANATLDASFHPLPYWSVNGAIDLAASDDLIGMPHQMLHLGTATHTQSVWIPDLRFGYQKNLTGSQLSSLAVGISLFNTVTLDARWALQKVVIDDTRAPRSLAFSLAFEEHF